MFTDFVVSPRFEGVAPIGRKTVLSRDKPHIPRLETGSSDDGDDVQRHRQRLWHALHSIDDTDATAPAMTRRGTW